MSSKQFITVLDKKTASWQKKSMAHWNSIWIQIWKYLVSSKVLKKWKVKTNSIEINKKQHPYRMFNSNGQ